MTAKAILIEISLTADEAKAHQFRPNQTVWLSATTFAFI